MGRISVKGYKTPDEMYMEYLDKHVAGVREVYETILKPILIEECVEDGMLTLIDLLITKHDASKKSNQEWFAYRNYFYDKENHSRSSEEFNMAWNYHQKRNPHHCQYWVLINDVDEPQLQAMEMPFEYVIELLCDWHSAGQHYGNTAYDWYDKQKDKMILHPNTRALIEKYLEYLK